MELVHCAVLYQRHTKVKKARVVLIGRESNVITAKLMIEWLIDSTRKNCKGLFHNKKSWNSYCLGVATGIQNQVERITAERTEVRNTSEEGLVVFDEVKDFVNEKYSSIREIRFTPSAVDHNFSKGRDYGENISLNRQCSSSEVLTLC